MQVGQPLKELSSDGFVFRMSSTDKKREKSQLGRIEFAAPRYITVLFAFASNSETPADKPYSTHFAKAFSAWASVEP